MDSLQDRASGVESAAVLAQFRRDFHQCLTARCDELFELADAVLCAEGTVRTLAGLSLAAVHQRGHGAPAQYHPGMAHYLFNFSEGDQEQAAALLRAKMWGIGGDEKHGGALAPADLVLIYLAPPKQEFIGQAELASAVHDWTAAEAEVCPGDSPCGVLLSQAGEWDPPVAMNTVLPRIDPTRRTPMSSRTPRPAFKGALSGSLHTTMRPSWRFGRKACPRLPESRQHPAQNAQICIAGGDAVRSTGARRTAGVCAVIWPT